MREVIARIHHQIRFQARQRMHELGLRPLPRNHMHIRDMQNPKVWRPHRKHRESFLAHLKIIQFDEAPIRRRGGSQSKPRSRKLHHTLCEVRTTCRFRSRHGCAGTGCVLTHRVPFFSTPSYLPLTFVDVTDAGGSVNFSVLYFGAIACMNCCHWAPA